MKVGIIGAGQLGRMLALAGYPLGIRATFLDPDPASSGGQVGPVVVGGIGSPASVRQLASQVDVVTYDIENVPVDVLEDGAIDTPIRPSPQALAVTQDRLSEKQLFETIGIPTTPYRPIADARDLPACGETLGFPLILKARRLGYDGRGQRIVRAQAELEPAWQSLGSVPAIAEAWVDFAAELSLIAARGTDGAIAFYPLAENVHDDGILYSSTAPYDDAALQSRAEDYLRAIMERFDYVGVLTVEFFLAGETLMANELAPRVHNSGHWTIEGAETSQFENHLRAILGLPLGSTAPTGHSFMINLLGRIPDRRQLLGIPGLHLHDYGKSERPKRKVGHCTVVTKDRLQLLGKAATLRAAVAQK